MSFHFILLLELRPSLWVLILICNCVSIQVYGADGYQEAPMLAKRVAGGELPPVETRLPESPAVVEPLHTIGKYGGTWRRLAIEPEDSLMGSRLGYEPLVRWDRKGTTPTPGVAERWEVQNGGQRYVLYLRRGLKWSDGKPFTSEDIRFCIEDLLTSEELGGRTVELAPRDTSTTFSVPSPHVVIFEFDKPNAIFLEKLCYLGHSLYQPAHYMKQFHIKYANSNELKRLMAAGGYDHWTELYLDKQDLHINVDLPTINPWKISVGPPALMYMVDRNPYYWKVDTAGNQLPYIDRISFQVADNAEVLNLLACTGGVDMQGRHIEMSKYSFFMSPENRKRGGIVRYRVLADPNSGGAAGVLLNLSTQNQQVRPYLIDRRFRIALSLAIDRQELVEIITGGLGDICNGVGFPTDRYFEPGLDQLHISYDPDEANRLLDEVGLVRGPNGMRYYPNGRLFREILYCNSWGTAGELEQEQLIVAYWREVGLDFVIKAEATEISRMRVRNGNTEFWFDAQAGLHWVLQPALYVPIKHQSELAPLYGRYIQTGGRSGIRPTEEIQRLVDWYYELVHTFGEDDRQLELGRNILWQWSRECYMIGLYRIYGLTIVSNRFRNCPDHFLHGWRVQSPGYTQPEQFFLESQEHDIQAHAGSNGTVHPSGQFQVYDGMEQEFKLTPAPGFAVAAVTVNGRSVGAVRSYRIDTVDRPVTLNVQFTREHP